MAKDRFPATLGGFNLKLETVSDSDGWAIVQQSPPLRDGAILKNMGGKAFSVRFRAHFFEATYDQYFDFRDFLKAAGRTGELIELSHPKYGLMQGMVSNLDAQHDNALRHAKPEFTFIQDLSSQEAPSEPFVQIEDATEQTFVTGQAQAADSIASAIDDVAGPETSILLETELDPDLPFTGQFVGISTLTRNYVRQLEVWANLWDSFLADVTAPATSLVNTITFGNDLIGRVIGPLSRACERCAVAAESLRNAPSDYLRTIKINLIDLQNQTTAAADAITGSTARDKYGDQGLNFSLVQSGQQLSASTAQIYAEDEDQRDKARNAESGPAFDLLGNYTPVPLPDQLMTSGQLDQTLALTRTEIQRAIEVDRAQLALRQAALNLAEHVAVTKLEASQIITINVEQPLPLELVLFAHGLPYTMAGRVLALNQDVENSNFIQGEFRIYVAS